MKSGNLNFLEPSGTIQACNWTASSLNFNIYIYIYIYIHKQFLCHLLTPCSTVLLQKLTDSQSVKKFPAFYGTRRFITAFTSARQLSLYWARSIQSIPPHHPTSWKSILILFFHLRLGLPSGLFPSVFPHQNPIYVSPSLHTCYIPSPSHTSPFYHPRNIGWAVQIIKLLIM